MVCFMQFVRRNNDCEEWHYSVNKIAHVSRMNFYELVEELYDIALDIPMAIEGLQQKGPRRVLHEANIVQNFLDNSWQS